MILDQYGREVFSPYRKALGFIDQYLPQREQDVVHGVTPPERTYMVGDSLQGKEQK